MLFSKKQSEKEKQLTDIGRQIDNFGDCIRTPEELTLYHSLVAQEGELTKQVIIEKMMATVQQNALLKKGEKGQVAMPDTTLFKNRKIKVELTFKPGDNPKTTLAKVIK